MKELIEEERLIRQYLLGELDEEGQRQFEARVFTDRAYLEQVLMAEDELVEDFVFDELTALDKERFLAHFLSSPQQVQKLEITGALKEYATRSKSTSALPTARVLAFWHSHKRLVKVAFAATLLLTILGGAWLLRPDQMVQELARLNGLQAGSSIQSNINDYAVTLIPVRIRSGEAGMAGEPDVTIPPNAQVVLLRLALRNNEYNSYRVVLQQNAGTSLVVDKLKAEIATDGKIIPVRIPARVLTPGYYQIMLSGYVNGKLEDNLDSYTFRILTKS